MLLIVDSNKRLLETMHGFLSTLGYDCISVQDSMQALDILAKNPDINLLICEQALPHCSGIELIRIASQSHPGMKNILISGYENVDIIPANVYFLAKPFHFESLGTIVGLNKTSDRPNMTPTHDCMMPSSS